MDSRESSLAHSLGDLIKKPVVAQAPASNQQTSLIALPVCEDVRWNRYFRRIHYKPGTGSERPQRYNSERNVSQLWLPLLEIDSDAGRGNCLAETIKQWDTIIKEAKIAKKVPEELKLVRYYFLGCVIEDIEAKDNPEKRWVFSKEDEGRQALEEAKDLPLPLEAYSTARYKKWLRSRTSRSFQPLCQSPQRVPPNSIILEQQDSAVMDTRGLNVSEDRVSESFHSRGSIYDGDILKNQALPTLPLNLSNQSLGQDYTYMTRAAEETKNDYEYVKGIGKVRINQDVSEPAKHVVDHAVAAKASPGIYALQDIEFQLRQFFMAGLCISNPEASSLAGLKFTKSGHFTLILKWQGKLDQTIRIFDDREILCILFKDVSAIAYNRGTRKIFFEDRTQTATHLSQPLGYLVEFSPMDDLTFQMIITCCYALIGEPARQCGEMPAEYFAQKINSFIKYREQQISKLSDLTSLARKALNTTPTKEHQSAMQNRLSTSSRKRSLTPSPTSSTTIKRRKSMVEENTIHKSSYKKATSQAASKIEHKVTMKGSSPLGLYYISTLGNETILIVGLNDLVVRRRSVKEREKGGKRDRMDLFDGPWRIVKFDKPEKTYGINHERNVSDGEDNGIEPQLDKDDIELMGKTKVKLNFPNGSTASPWVELNRLIPALDTKEVHTSEIYSSNLTVADHEGFHKLRQNLVTRNAEHEEEDTQMAETTSKPVPLDDLHRVTNPIYLVEIKKGIHVAVIEVASQGLEDSDRYEVEKLRGKRLRLYDKDSAIECPELVANKIIAAEYKVHWAGWPDEDDTWTLGTGNIPGDFIVEYHAQTDPLRDTSPDLPASNPKNLIFSDDLDKSKKKGRKIKGDLMIEGRRMNSKAKGAGSRSVHFLEVRNELSEKVATLDEGGFVEGDPQDVLDVEKCSGKAIQRSLGDLRTKMANRGPTTPRRETGVMMQDSHAKPKANENHRVMQQQVSAKMHNIYAEQKAQAGLQAAQQQSGETS